MPATFYPEGTDALPFDSEQRSLVKIVALGGGGGAGGVLTGTGDPNGVVTGFDGQLYVDLSNSQIWVNRGGGTVWV